MSDQKQEHAARHADGLPSLLPFLEALQAANVKRVIKNQASGLKTDAVFPLVAFVLPFVPGEQM